MTGFTGVTGSTETVDCVDSIDFVDFVDLVESIDSIDFTDSIDSIDFVDFTDPADSIPSPLLLPLFSLSKKEGMGVTTDATCMWVLLASTADRNTSWKATNNTSSLNNRICFLSVLRLMS